MTFEEALQGWLDRSNKIAYKPLTIDPRGRKYVRILCDHSAFAFIDKATGNVLKPDTWARPAPQPRGNIYQVGHEGVERYGVHYLR